MNLYDVKTNEEIALPRILEDMNGREWNVLNVEQLSGNGKAGKVRAAPPLEVGARLFYPGVFGCYIADAPRENGATT